MFSSSRTFQNADMGQTACEASAQRIRIFGLRMAQRGRFRAIWRQVLRLRARHRTVRSVRSRRCPYETCRQIVPLSPPFEPVRSPKIGIALGGGFDASGPYRHSESPGRENIPVDFIAGTSVGAVIGACMPAAISARNWKNGFPGSIQGFSRWTFSRFVFSA